MLMDRPDIGTNARLQFVYAEAQPPLSPRIRGANDSAAVERVYFIPHVPSYFTDPNDAATKIMKAFLGRAERADAGAFNRRHVKRLVPMADPARPKCFAQSMSLEILGTAEARQFLNTSIPDEMGGSSVKAAEPMNDGGSVWKATVYYAGLSYQIGRAHV